MFRCASPVLVLAGVLGLMLLPIAGVPTPSAQETALQAPDDLAFFGSMANRAAGSEGADRAAEYILKTFRDAGLSEIGVQKFLTPIPESGGASIEVGGGSIPLCPWGPNLVYLPKTPGEGLRGPLVYVGNGNFDQFDGKRIDGSIVLMDLASYGNWMNALTFGARALIFLGDPNATVGEFQQKETETPLAFPRFWVDPERGETLKQLALSGAPEAVVTSQATWQNRTVRNCYGLLPGKDPKLKKQMIVLDAFYDASSHVLGAAPGADEAVSITMLLHLVRTLAQNPPDRSVLFLATVDNGQSLAGMRQFIWAATGRTKLIRKETKALHTQKMTLDRQIELIGTPDPFSLEDPKDRELLWQVVVEAAKDKSDALTREAQAYRSRTESKPVADRPEAAQPTPPNPQPPPQLDEARIYRRISWLSSLEEATAEQRGLALKLLNQTAPELKLRRKEVKLREEALKSSGALRSLMVEHDPVLFLSLYLSSHSSSVGLTEMGETYPVRENIRRVVRATRLADLLSRLGAEVSEQTRLKNLIRGTSRRGPAEESPGKLHLTSRPCCDVGALAGLPAVSLMTLNDDRSVWATPNDTLDRVDRSTLEELSKFFPPLLEKLFSSPALHGCYEGGLRGLASLEGQAMFVRQGELFPDKPAPGTIISVLQGNSIFRAMVFRDGTFFIPGLANSRVSLEKLILEPYGIDPETGRVGWTADKVQTNKVNYRIKVKTDLASTSLVMFYCDQTDIPAVFDPQDLNYLTKVDLLDAMTDATPVNYWYSRVDGRNTMAISVFLPEGTRFKLIMAQSLLGKEFFLLNGSPELTTGRGFPIGNPATLLLAPYQVAQDLYRLLGKRLANLSEHGIVNRHLEETYAACGQRLEAARADVSATRYGAFWKNVVPAWAQLDAVYAEIESTQRDVLSGVMFFIALFVPFAYCMERYLFAFRGIYQQIVAFLIILIMTILAIRALNPAFQLTYSPMVVILAFFIVGLSLLVSWIIFMRLESEMAELHQRAAHIRTPQTSKWQSFGAGFAIGVSNLNRRKLRTGLTCVTLVILTFTVMSFTNVKSLHQTTRSRIADEAVYDGVLLRNQYWLPLTFLTLDDLATRFGGEARIWPRGWVEPFSASERSFGRVYGPGGHAVVGGVLGLGAGPPQPFLKLIRTGRWFDSSDGKAVLLSLQMAARLGLDPGKNPDASVRFMGDTYRVVGTFDANELEAMKDLDQNPVTPAYLEVNQGEELSEVEVEAMQSGEEILPTTERFRYADPSATIIVPFKTCVNYGGVLKALSILPQPGQSPLELADRLASWLAYPLFVGENGTWYSSASTTMRYQGAANLIVPILIVIFITLNTMVGHVHERKREIGTYTSVGLAPTHVGFLFIVEALSMAVISIVIGYIIAQLSAKTLGHTAAFSQLTFNYSSMASVACMVLVFSIVFLAALYPARLAAEIAMPDVNRTWTLPPPEGDVIFMNLPFLLKFDEERGVMGFLDAFFRSHQDVAQGTFIVDETLLDVDVPQLKPGEVPELVCLLIRTNVWLSPFDFGIKQRLQLHCCPSLEEPGYLEIAIQMIRLSGERTAWVRANKSFIKALRKQMLLWRLLDREAKEHYQQLAPVAYDGQLGGAAS